MAADDFCVFDAKFGFSSIEIESSSKLVETIEQIATAVQQGELDGALAKVANERGKTQDGSLKGPKIEEKTK